AEKGVRPTVTVLDGLEESGYRDILITVTESRSRADEESNQNSQNLVDEPAQLQLRDLRQQFRPTEFVSGLTPAGTFTPDLDIPVTNAFDSGETDEAAQAVCDQQAAHDFAVAEFYRRAGHAGTARFYYQLVQRRYAGSHYAELAARRAAGMTERTAPD